jgi:transcriptional regulator with XRE-family HTH domain
VTITTNVNPASHAPQTLYRGLYVKIARELGVDPSYVSRVARGDRRSSEIEDALRQALEKIERRLGRSTAENRNSVSGQGSKRLKVLMKQNRSWIRNQWLAHSQSDPNLRQVKIPAKKRTAAIALVLHETIKVMNLSLKELATASMKAAEHHGRTRRAQGFTAMALVEEYNLVRRCIFALAQEHCQQMDAHLLIQDLTQFGEALDLQTQRALRDYLAS